MFIIVTRDIEKLKKEKARVITLKEGKIIEDRIY